MIRKVHNSLRDIRDRLAKVDRRIDEISAEIRADIRLGADTGSTLARLATRDLLCRKRIRIVDNLVSIAGPKWARSIQPNLD